MSITPTKPVCIDPDIGEAAAQALGRVPSKAVETHRSACTACEIERLAFESLDEHAIEPTPALRAWVQAVVRARTLVVREPHAPLLPEPGDP